MVVRGRVMTMRRGVMYGRVMVPCMMAPMRGARIGGERGSRRRGKADQGEQNGGQAETLHRKLLENHGGDRTAQRHHTLIPWLNAIS